jgi:putative SOS response-associated peptidase YedK
MCGRYSNGEKITITTRFAEQKTFHLEPHYNNAPTQRRAVLMLKDGKMIEEERRWGNFPKWAKDTKEYPMINLKAETILEKFRNVVTNNRCLVPADGFYEWEKTPTEKLPWRFVLKSGEPFCFAGVYDTFTPKPTSEDDEPQPLNTYAILTIEPNRLVKKIHDRMPVILRPEQYDLWLNPQPFEDSFKSALQTLPEDLMESYRVSKLVNSAKNDTPDLLKPI